MDAKQVERSAEAVGREIALDERSVVEPVAPLRSDDLLGMDGTGVPRRPSELQGRVGKQPDGSAKTREVKLCTLWSAEGRDKEGTRAHGLCTSTGVVEAGCKVAIGARLKRAGMYRTVALRCCKVSGRFEDFRERRSAAAAG